MERVLIISYFFPPCNLTAAQRTGFWAESLYEFGYKPIVVTRHWDKPVKKIKDASKTSDKAYQKKVYNNYEVHQMPYRGNFRDKLYEKYGEHKYYLLRVILTIFELLSQNFFVKIIPFSNFYTFSRDFLSKNPDIKKVVISGNPFSQFFFGYLLHKEFGIKWVADYRDAWSTSTINNLDRSWLFKLLTPLERNSEKKWIDSASLFSSVSQPLVDEINTLTGVKGKVLYNGFVEEDFLPYKEEKKFDVFTITHAGTLYQGQDITIFCEAIKQLISKIQGIEINILFPGIGANAGQAERIKEALKGFESYYEITERLPRDEILKLEVKSHLLFYPAWKGHKGIIASKIYEYLASKTMILVAPGDRSCIDEIMQKTTAGKVTNTVLETYEYLFESYQNYLEGEATFDRNEEAIAEYSREKQVEKLAEILDEI